jgi:hypothetical protein
MLTFGARFLSGLVLFALSLLTTAAPIRAQECDLREIALDGSDQLPNIKANFTCVTRKLDDALTRIKTLESELQAFRASEGLVAAFNREPSSPCPENWELFAPAGGRFIIGAGDNTNKDENGNDLSDHTVGTTKGEEKHAQQLEELVPHQHEGRTEFASPAERLVVVYQAGPTILPNHAVGFTGGPAHRAENNIAIPGAEHKHIFKTDSTLGALGKPENNLPPFIALYYCIKKK